VLRVSEVQNKKAVISAVAFGVYERLARGVARGRRTAAWKRATDIFWQDRNSTGIESSRAISFSIRRGVGEHLGWLESSCEYFVRSLFARFATTFPLASTSRVAGGVS
jgi:hypothetical protein